LVQTGQTASLIYEAVAIAVTPRTRAAAGSVAHAGLGPEVVLLDIGIPGMSVYEVAQRLRRTQETKNATLVAITGWGEAEDQQRSMEAGFDHYLLKPVKPETLHQLLASILMERALID
jgi:two-component system CheB/CheR fusion protein